MRVIAGRLGGQRLVAPKHTTTRPTSDRVRQALFDVLNPVVRGAVVLDLFAGTGALGIEAVSRGAERAVFVEVDALALAAIESNVAKLGISRDCLVLGMPVERARQRLLGAGPFDLILCDPPWADAEEVARTLLPQLLGASQPEANPSGLLKSGGRIVLEHSARKPIETLGGLALQLLDRRIWGDTAISIFS